MVSRLQFSPRYFFLVLAAVVTLLLWSSSSILPSDQSHGPLPPVPETPEANAEKPTPSPPRPSIPSKPSISSKPQAEATESAKTNPIDGLIKQAQASFDDLLSRQSKTLDEAAQDYRKRRGRHPPPGFDEWYKYASENDALIAEEFWDQIYDDLNPYWAVDPPLIRSQAKSTNMVVNIKNGVAEADTDWFWHVIWAKMINTVSEHLPNMIIPMNSMDEPRLFVPWEVINELVGKANRKKDLVSAIEVVDKFKGWSIDEPKEVEVPAVQWKKTTTYTLARQACAPDSPVRMFTSILEPDAVLDMLADPGVETDPNRAIYERYLGPTFVTNYTLESNTCNDPMIGGVHGALINPITSNSAQQLTPLFGGSKLSVNNEILLPAPMYWNEEERFTGGPDVAFPWEEKMSQVIWRGTATGGTNTPTNWQRFHRHRFNALANGTKAEISMNDKHDPFFTLLFRENSIGTLSPALQQQLPQWLKEKMDVAFTDIMCEEGSGGTADDCWYTSPYFETALGMSMQEQFHYKYLPDIDGNSFSGRYRAFLLSTSLPIKATLYREWHDSRLVAWKHFVPMDNRFSDFYRIMEYFEGFTPAGSTEVVSNRDAVAKQIAMDGRDWAQKVLRRVDMQIYIFRLLLEYGRVTEDDRDLMGFVADLK